MDSIRLFWDFLKLKNVFFEKEIVDSLSDFEEVIVDFLYILLGQ